MAFNLSDHPAAFLPPAQRSIVSAWLPHIPIVPILIQLLRPRTFVELGTHMGDSYLAFCRAFRDLGLPAHATAIDTWEGDDHTGPYGPDILTELRALHDAPFGAFSTLLRSTFDDAVKCFPDATIDLLHIDGSHTYAAVRHDWETWLPKLSDRGVVLLHDTTEHDQGFGVWRLWEEIRTHRPHANLAYGHGLGLLAVGTQVPPPFLEFLYELNSKPHLVKILAALGDTIMLRQELHGAVFYLHHCQVLLNEWRQRTQQPIRNPTPNMEAATKNSSKFGTATVQDTHQLVTDALNLVAEVLALREKK